VNLSKVKTVMAPFFVEKIKEKENANKRKYFVCAPAAHYTTMLLLLTLFAFSFSFDSENPRHKKSAQC